MKFSSFFLATAAAGFFSALSCQGAVTLFFNNFFVGGISSNLADKNGVVSNGLAYGIIVDTAGNGFLNAYDQFSTTPDAVTQLNSGFVHLPSDDILIMAGDLTSDASQGGVLFEGDFTPGGNGGVVGIQNLSLTGGVSAGNRFELIWFDWNGVNVGILNDPSFVLPADNGVGTYDSPFVGIDPVRPADQLLIAPEPSSWALGLLGATALLRRRRR